MIDAAYINALGWTLIHSIWQLTLLVLIFYALLLWWRDRSPVLRYRVSLLFMLGSLSVTCLTFIVMFRKYASIPPEWEPVVMEVWTGIRAEPSGWWSSLIHFLQTNVTSLTYLYITGVALLMLRSGFNLWSLHRLKSHATPIDPEQFDFLPEFMEKMNVASHMSIRSSVRARIPMVIGAFQPVVLIPLSMLSHTPPHILKAVLAHELAHIERHDFAANLIQTLVETLFFYHPAVWYISQMARREREYCCDQRAVEVGCLREDLVRALAEVGEMQQAPAMSMSLRGQSHELLDRVKYLLGMKPALRYMPDHSIWYYGSLLGVFLLFSIGKHHFFPTEEPVRIELDALTVYGEDEAKVMLFQSVDSMTALDQDDGSLIMVTVDTSIHNSRRDTLPRPKRSVKVRSHRDGKITVNGKEIHRYDTEKIRAFQDSLRTMHLNIRRSLPDPETMDSLRLVWKEEYRNMIDNIKNHITDSFPQGFRFAPGDRRHMFGIVFPDSTFNYYFTTPPTPPMPPVPPVPPMYLDSVFGQNMLESWGKSWGDSTFQSLKYVPFQFSTDSLMTYFYMPYRERRKQMHEHREQSREIQELNREIRKKQRELQELQRERQKIYREERN